MAYKTKTALIAESESTFTTNGVRAITAASHRTFNQDLIDSLDTISFNGEIKTSKKRICSKAVRYLWFLGSSKNRRIRSDRFNTNDNG